MRELVESRLARLAEVEELLADPSIVSDRLRYKKVNQEYKHLRQIAELGLPYLETLDEIEGARALLENESDAEMRELAKEELQELNARIPDIEESLELLLLPRDPDDSRDAILEIRAGTGGEEAALFAGNIARMYQRYAEREGWKMEMLEFSPTATGAAKEVIFSLQGDGAYGRLRYENGVHRVQRVPETESSGRIHTSACSVVVLPEAEEVEVQIGANDLKVDVYRSSGPGGQSVNTTDSAVRITHIPTGLVVTCQDEKSQHKNKAKAMRVLQARLYEMERSKQHEAEAKERKAAVAGGDRSAKIRTYNVPQQRVTDHRFNYTSHELSKIMDGDLDALLDFLLLHFRQQLLEQQGE
jgi:peptide chain release factor 1